MKINDQQIMDQIVQLIQDKKTVAPRDIATALVQTFGTEGDDWRKLLPRIRFAADQLASAGKLSFWRKGKVVSSKGLKGVYRFCKAQEPSPEGPKENEE